MGSIPSNWLKWGELMTTAVGVLAEVKDGERRVALDPHAVAMLTSSGLKVLVQCNAGVAAGFSDTEYLLAGADLVSNVDEVWGADLVVKVKEPLPGEFRQFRPGLKLFCYLHLAAAPELAAALQDAGVEAHAFETVREGQGLPLLAPMSDIAGRSAAIMGAYYLAQGSGTLLGGSAGVPPARVVVIGMGVAGTMAARGARGMDAEVTGVDVNLERLRQLQFDGTVTATLVSSSSAIGAQGLGVGRPRHRSGRLHRNLATDFALRPRLRRERRHSLLRDQRSRTVSAYRQPSAERGDRPSGAPVGPGARSPNAGRLAQRVRWSHRSSCRCRCTRRIFIRCLEQKDHYDNIAF